MNKKEISFPQYRRYLNGKNYFRINSLQSFEELRSLGGKWSAETYEVKILPDHHLVNDLLFHYEAFAEEISAEAYEQVRKLLNSRP